MIRHVYSICIFKLNLNNLDNGFDKCLGNRQIIKVKTTESSRVMQNPLKQSKSKVHIIIKSM